ncbi:MAG: prepilin-type N-terminal cleavage/methylation domain-containing protein [bacterium]|nr:prepilin-type N-terminal cleavage/methylation domain-containing protein [bacterium]
MKTIKHNEKGFSLVEMMVTMSLFIIILGSVYFMTAHYAETARTKHSQVRTQQEGRFFLSVFAQEIKECGSVIARMRDTFTKSFDPQSPPPMIGLYPLNNGADNDFADGIILATGDPEATICTLTTDFTPGGNELKVFYQPVQDESDGLNLTTAASTTIQTLEGWDVGDKGIILWENAYYVFLVEGVATGNNTLQSSLTIRSEPVYFSGLLNTANYVDESTQDGYSTTYVGVEKGDDWATGQSDSGAVVIRLSNFGVYLFKVKPVIMAGTEQSMRQMVRLNDAWGEADVLANWDDVDIDVLSDFVWDMQISYIAYDKIEDAYPNMAVDPTHHYFGASGTSASHEDLMTDLSNRKVTQVSVTFVAITGEYAGKGTTTHLVPAIGDHDAYTTPEGKYGIKVFTFFVAPRNLMSTGF